MKKKSKILAGILMCGVLATGIGTLAGCGGKNNSEPLSSTTDIYGFAGATTAMLASDQAIGGQMIGANNTNSSLQKNLETMISGTLDKYMNIFDSITGGKKPVDVKETAVEDEFKNQYNHKLVISVGSIDGEETNYTMYFNETLLDSDEEVDDIDEEERETKLSGVLFVNDDRDQALYVTGKKEVEQENDESEMEVEFVASYFESGSERENDKIVFKQEKSIENGEVEEEYAFSIVVDGMETQMNFDLERDTRGNIEVEYEYNVGNLNANFEIEKNRNLMILKTKGLLDNDIVLNVTSESNPENVNQVRYKYVLVGDYGDLESGLVINGAWRTIA